MYIYICLVIRTRHKLADKMYVEEKFQDRHPRILGKISVHDVILIYAFDGISSVTMSSDDCFSLSECRSVIST